MNIESSQRNTSEIITLKIGLSQFGLRPTDWDIIPQSNNYHLIKNKFEKDFYFIGKANQKYDAIIDWKYITLASL